MFSIDLGGGAEIVLRDSTRREHKVTIETDISGIANDLIVWLAGRIFPGRPAQHTSTF